MKIISSFKDINQKNWSDFILKHPYGNIYQSPEMYAVYEKTPSYKPIVIACIKENEIIGILLAVIIKEYSRLLGFLTSRSIITGGPVVLNNNSNVLDLLLKEYNSVIKKSVIYSQIRNFLNQEEVSHLFYNNGFKFYNHLNIKLDLQNGEEFLWNNFSRSRKKGIKKAQKSNFELLISNKDTDIESFYNLLTLSYKRIKLPIPSNEHFYSIKETLNPENFKFFFLFLDGKPVISMLALIYNKTMYGYYMGLTNDIEILKNKPSDLFFWEIFKWCINHNIRYFDWMGAGKPDKDYGVRDFKLQFGGNLVSFGRFEKIHLPVLFSLAKFGLKIWKLLKK